MSNGNFHGSFDTEVYKQFGNIVGKGNIKKSLEQFMINVIASTTKDIEGVDLQLLNLDIEKEQRKISKLHAEIKDKLLLKEKIEMKMKEGEETRLKKEKEALEKIEKCCVCGCKIVGKPHKVPNGMLCGSCRLSIADPLIGKKAGLI